MSQMLWDALLNKLNVGNGYPKGSVYTVISFCMAFSSWSKYLRLDQWAKENPDLRYLLLTTAETGRTHANDEQPVPDNSF